MDFLLYFIIYPTQKSKQKSRFESLWNGTNCERQTLTGNILEHPGSSVCGYQDVNMIHLNTTFLSLLHVFCISIQEPETSRLTLFQVLFSYINVLFVQKYAALKCKIIDTTGA